MIERGGTQIADDDVGLLWDSLAEILVKRGWNLQEIVDNWAKKELEQIRSEGADDDLRELCKAGCVSEVLGILLRALRWSPGFEEFWRQAYGAPDARIKVERSLRKIADQLQNLFAFTVSVEDDEVVSKLADFGHIPPGQLISELRFYGQMLKLLGDLPKESKARTLADLIKFFLIDYVKISTGHFRDRNVSSLLAVVVGIDSYNEVAQRMWRNRNFKRMKPRYPKVAEFLVALGHVIQSRSNASVAK
jgi:hypothetical protein